MIKLVVLDFDDTFCLTEEACFDLENDIAKEMGFAPMTRALHKKNWGKPLEDAIKERVPGINAHEFMERVTKAIPEYIAQEKYDVISQKNLLALKSLRDAGRRLAILTSRTAGEARHLLHEKHPLNNHIEAFYHKDN